MDTHGVDVAGNLARVRDRITRAAAAAGRRDPITLVAVTKQVPLESVLEACRAGQLDLGENRVQDALPRREALPALLAAAGLPPGAARWHFIGHIQGNKARRVVGFHLLHAVDGWALAQRLDAAAAAGGMRQPILIEVNITREPQKHGADPGEVAELAARLAGCAALAPQGLMCMARFGAPEGELRATFAGLRELAAAARRDSRLPLPHLSMGMSDDFEAAVAEGATIVRIGTAIFGARGG